MGFGGNPYGPAGTGKTESVKALGQAFGRQVRRFNLEHHRSGGDPKGGGFLGEEQYAPYSVKKKADDVSFNALLHFV